MKGKLLALRRVAGDPAEMSDVALLAACAVGDSAALGALFDRHRSAVQRFLARLADQRDTDDLVQETFLQVNRSADRFRGRSSVKTWILGIAVTDRVTITTFRPPDAFAIRHEGLFGGGGHMTLRPGADGSTTIVEWEEFLVPPWLPAVGWMMGRPIIAWLYQRDLFLLRDVVEAEKV